MSYFSDIRKKIGHDLLLLAGSNVIILNDNGHVLLQHRLDGGWGLPGGLLEPGESLEETARREVKEETNITLHELVPLKVFSGAEYTFTLKNNDIINVITALYVSKKWDGELKNDVSEGYDLRFFPLDTLPMQLDDEYRTYINYYLELTRI